MSPAIVRQQHRSGVLMLVVVSMLTLFLLLGTTYLVVAARAKQAARAQARLAMDSSSIGIAPARLLDGVMLKVVRGGTGGVSSPKVSGSAILTLPAGSNVSFESLLGDKYGDGLTKTGTATAIEPVSITSSSGSTSSPLLTCTLQISGLQAADLPGRVLTILGSNREPTSHRILSGSASGGAFSVLLSNPARRRPFSLPTTPVDVVLNGLEFVLDGSSGNEPYDAFDDKNVFLSHVSPKDKANSSSDQTVAGSKTFKFGYVTSGTNPALATLSGSNAPSGLDYGADNDNDGTPDGFFLDFGLPSVPAPSGVGTVDFHASVLVVDLDSRFNVNAHGSLTSITYPTATLTGTDCPGWPTGTDAPSPGRIPVGSGYGPPEVNGGWMFLESSYAATEKSRRMRGPNDPNYSNNGNSDANSQDDEDAVVPSLSYIFSGADAYSQTLQKRPNTSRFAPNQPLPRMKEMEGKYGEGQDITKFVCNCTDVPKRQSSGTWSKLGNSSFPLARPGAPNTNDTLSLIRDGGVTPSASNAVTGSSTGVPAIWWSGSASYDWAPSGGSAPRGTYNSPPDLHGSMLTTTATASDVVPRLILAKPDWGSGESTDDPYELRLDPRAARNGSMTTTGSVWDNVFGYADLEGVLRQYDLDAQRLPRRLVQILGPASEEARLRVTTDGWDTTTITGSAATTIRSWLNGATGALSGTSAVSGIIANDVARGERLNLNRPLTSSKPASYDASDPYYVQRQALFKDLFTLLVSLGGTATNATTAQWAANVVEFQDADSTITPFEYDTNPQDGWDIDNDATTTGDTDRGLVWGTERPEILIAETSAWEDNSRGELYVEMHRPWEAWALASGSRRIPAEPVDVELDCLTGGTATNQVDLGKKSEKKSFSDSSTYPVWRLRIKDANGNTSHVRFDINSGSSGMFAVASATSANSTPRLGAGEWLCLTGGTLAPSTTLPTVPVTSPTVLCVPGPLPTSPYPASSPRSATVYLERLSDPTAAVTAGIWSQDPETAFSVPMYRVVDSGTIQVVNRYVVPPTNPPAPSVSSRQSATFWKTAFGAPQTTDFTFTPSHVTASGSAAWFVWPNRPFVSAAELFLVPKWNAADALVQYTKPTAAANDLLTLAGLKVPLLMDAVHVPSRFAGTHTTINASGTGTLATYGIYPEATPINQLSSYREPGRVNLNTITTDDVWNAVVAGSLTKSGTANPVKTRSATNFSGSPATSLLNLLSLSSSGTSVIKDTDSDLTAIQPRNPMHEIYTATRLANTATTRSNVFAVWVTVRESISGDPDSVKLHRGFYIVDRSIPVAYDPGKNHNVWDCVVLRRIIE